MIVPFVLLLLQYELIFVRFLCSCCMLFLHQIHGSILQGNHCIFLDEVLFLLFLFLTLFFLFLHIAAYAQNHADVGAVNQSGCTSLTD